MFIMEFIIILNFIAIAIITIIVIIKDLIWLNLLIEEIQLVVILELKIIMFEYYHF